MIENVNSFSFMSVFSRYTYVKSYGLISKWEKIESIDLFCIYTAASQIGWGVECRSVFLDDVYYPYGLDRKDVFLRFR